MDQTKYNLSLDMQQINVIIAALQELAFKFSAPVIGEIERQVRAQAEQAAQAAQTPVEQAAPKSNE